MLNFDQNAFLFIKGHNTYFLSCKIFSPLKLTICFHIKRDVFLKNEHFITFYASLPFFRTAVSGLWIGQASTTFQQHAIGCELRCVQIIFFETSKFSSLSTDWLCSAWSCRFGEYVNADLYKYRGFFASFTWKFSNILNSQYRAKNRTTIYTSAHTRFLVLIFPRQKVHLC